MHSFEHEEEDHDKGLLFDLEHISRRGMLHFLVKAGMTAGLLGCGSSGTASNLSSNNGNGNGSLSSENGACSTIPPETAGPYPADGSNGPNVLTTSGILRSDIRTSFAGLSGTAEGIPLTIILNLININTNCSALPGIAIYLWHCDRSGAYSIYDLTSENFLRGLQETNSAGQVSFTSIFPGCYAGRWPHLHFEVYPSLASATSAANKVNTSQIAMTSNACNQVYASSGYGTSQANFSGVSLSTDNVFSDGYALQIPEISGDLSGFTLRLDVAIAV